MRWHKSSSSLQTMNRFSNPLQWCVCCYPILTSQIESLSSICALILTADLWLPFDETTQLLLSPSNNEPNLQTSSAMCLPLSNFDKSTCQSFESLSSIHALILTADRWLPFDETHKSSSSLWTMNQFSNPLQQRVCHYPISTSQLANCLKASPLFVCWSWQQIDDFLLMRWHNSCFLLQIMNQICKPLQQHVCRYRISTSQLANHSKASSPVMRWSWQQIDISLQCVDASPLFLSFKQWTNSPIHFSDVFAAIHYLILHLIIIQMHSPPTILHKTGLVIDSNLWFDTERWLLSPKKQNCLSNHLQRHICRVPFSSIWLADHWNDRLAHFVVQALVFEMSSSLDLSLQQWVHCGGDMQILHENCFQGYCGYRYLVYGIKLDCFQLSCLFF